MKNVAILIVEDECLIAEELKFQLEAMGHRVTGVENSAAAALGAAKCTPPDLVLMDVRLRGTGDGIAAAAELQERSGVPVIFMSGYTDAATVDRAMTTRPFGYLVKPVREPELRLSIETALHRHALERHLRERAEQHLRARAEAEADRDVLREHATRDALTGLWNRRMILTGLDRELARGRREGSAVLTALVDLDFFKRINDTHGHLIGDRVLRETALRLQNAVRPYDMVGRYGGEELLVVSPVPFGTDGAAFGERLRVAVCEGPVPTSAGPIRVTASIGVAVSGPGASTAEDVLRAADEALYRAKAGGRNRVECAGPATGSADRAPRSARPEPPLRPAGYDIVSAEYATV